MSGCECGCRGKVARGGGDGENLRSQVVGVVTVGVILLMSIVGIWTTPPTPGCVRVLRIAVTCGIVVVYLQVVGKAFGGNER